MMWILPALLLIAPAASLDPPVREQPAILFATVGHSEWCPAGNVQLDLRTGDYVLTARAARRVCQDPELVRPVVQGRIEPAPLTGIRAACARVQAEGLDACRGGRHEELVISNGGTPVLVLTNGARTIAAPSAYTCWSKAALALHNAIDAPFESLHRR